MADDAPIRPEIVRWTGPSEALRPDEVTAAPLLDDGELLDRLLVIVRDAETRLEEIATAETTEVFRWLRAEVGALLVARASGAPRAPFTYDAPASHRVSGAYDYRFPWEHGL